MRTIQLVRPKKTEGLALKPQVLVDGKPFDKLKNDSYLTIQLDEGPHDIEVKLTGFFFGNPRFNNRIHIPANGNNYVFQTDLVANAGGKGCAKVMFRCIPGQLLKEEINGVEYLGCTLTSIILEENFQNLLRQYPDPVLELQCKAVTWQLNMIAGGTRYKVVEQAYYFPETSTSIEMTAAHLSYQIPFDDEHREKYRQVIVQRFLQLIPEIRTAQ